MENWRNGVIWSNAEITQWNNGVMKEWSNEGKRKNHILRHK